MNRVRFWSVYSAAWLPYGLSYYVLFSTLPWSVPPLRQTLYNVAPAALLGSLIVPWSRLFSWTLHRRWWFYPGQLLSALLYSLLWYGGVLLVSSLGHALETHHFVLGYFSSYALQWQAFSGLMIYGNIAAIMYVLQVNQSLQQEGRRRLAAEAMQTSAELATLRAQLNPHFLFNTLNSIMALAGPDQPRTTQAIAELAAMLRYTLGQASEEEGVSLRQELAFTEQYLALESLRLGDRLHIVRHIAPETLACQLPPLTLQPLVENAIRHGLAPQVGGGTLVLHAELSGSVLHLSVQDNGRGCDGTKLPSAAGLGLRSVGQRLELFSGGQARLTIQSSPRRGFHASIVLPVEFGTDSVVPSKSLVAL